METSTEKLLRNLTYLYENIFNLLNAFQQATLTGTTNDITVELKNIDGTTSNVVVNSFQQIQQELTRIDNNFKSLLSPTSYILDENGNISQYTKTSFLNADYISNFKLYDDCIVDKTATLQNLVFPTIKLPIELTTNNLSEYANSNIYEITNGFENIPENVTEIALKYLIESGQVIGTNYFETIYTNKQKISTFGKFNTESVTSGDTSNIFNITVNTIYYGSTNTIGNTIQLQIDDILVSESGATKYKILNIDTFNLRLVIERIGGVEVPNVGINNLMFNEVVETLTNVVNLPIRSQKQMVVFLSTENKHTIGYPTTGIKIDTSTFNVIVDNETYSIDEYIDKFVTNFSEYLTGLISENSIPYSLGIKPEKPILDSSNFKVVQINKHIVDVNSQAELTELNKQKQALTNDIEYKQTQINTIQKDLDTNKYTTIEEKNQYLEKIVSLRNDINTIEANKLTIIRNIDNNAAKYGLKTITPKYKIIGFWDLQENLYSSITTTQHIIKYDVQYRYLSKNIDTSDATTYKMISNGNSITVAFSNWNELQTHTLIKTTNNEGNLVWEQPMLDSVNDININQCAITINEGESVEIKVRAVTEAGYPVSPMVSDWSDTLRIDFPDDITDSNLQSTVEQNSIDLNTAEFNSLLNNLGLLTHISGTIKESEKTFFHNAKDISSGQYTAEQKNIPLDECIKTILNEIQTLKNTTSLDNINIEFVDFDGESYSVQNNSTLEVSAGNYIDNYDTQNSDLWGSIVSKRGYIKIRNNNTLPVELKTLIPGTTLNNINAPTYYNVPVIFKDDVTQESKSIIYFRNVDIVGGSSVLENELFKLVVPKSNTDNLIPNESDIDSAAEQKDKNLVVRNFDNSISVVKLKTGSLASNYLAFTTEHPDYDINNLDNMTAEFDRLSKFSPNLKALQYQSEVDNTDINFVGFKNNDIYSVGRYSCGAWLYPYMVNGATLQVVGDTTISSLIIPTETELLVPIIFEYRMTDRLGNINGEVNYNINDGLSYSKKIGIDMVINNTTFKFDLKVNCNYKSKISALASKNVSTITANFNSESKKTLN